MNKKLFNLKKFIGLLSVFIIFILAIFLFAQNTNSSSQIQNDKQQTYLKSVSDENTTFVLNREQISDWNITSGSLEFNILTDTDHSGTVEIEKALPEGDPFVAKNLFIPSFIIYNDKQYNVTGIASQAFANVSLNGSIHLGDAITTIGDEAFANSGLQVNSSIVIPKYVNKIGDMAFFGLGTQKFYLESTKTIDIGTLSFGYENNSLFVYPTIYDNFIKNRNLIGYNVVKMKKTTKMADWAYLKENDDIFDKKAITLNSFIDNECVLSAFTCKPNTDDVNPALKCELTCLSDPSFASFNWLKASSMSSGDIALNITLSKIPSFANSCLFNLKLFSDENKDICFYRSFIIVLGNEEQEYTNYQFVYNQNILYSNPATLKVKHGSYLYFDPFAVSISNHVFPTQDQTISINSINNKYKKYVAYNENTNVLSIAPNAKNGNAVIIFSITLGNDIQQYTLTIGVFGNRLPLILGLTIPLGVLIIAGSAFLIYYLLKSRKIN